MSFRKEIAELSGQEINQLDAIWKGDAPYYVRHRAHAILLIHKDKRELDDVAGIFNVHSNTIYNWMERWETEGVDGMYDMEGRGCKPMFSAQEEQVIIECLEKEPRSMRKVVGMVKDLLGKKAGVETLRRIARRHGKSWKRQRKNTKGKPDDIDYEKGEQDLKELKLLEQQDEFNLVYFDESGFSLQPYIPYAWQDIGREGTIGIPSSRSIQINVLGFLHPGKNELSAFEFECSVDSQVVIEVMDAYCQEIDEPTVVVIDNASIHKSKAVGEKITEWEKLGLTLYFLPPYSPELNLIEILWRKMKYDWMPTWAYKCIGNLRNAIDEIICNFGSNYKISFSSPQII
jgi:transposase